LRRSALRVLLGASATLLLAPAATQARLRLPALFTDHLVLQQQAANRVWGWAAPGQRVEVTVVPQGGAGEQTITAVGTADAQGRWSVTLRPLPAGGPYTIDVATPDARRQIRDVLVGEVWLCSGQSNMQWSVRQSKDADLEIPAANFPHIRLITVPQYGTQQPQDDFDGRWQLCTPETAADFSAVGYYFGRMLHEHLGVPVGLIDNAWGGSACEAWIPREVLAADARYQPLLQRWAETEKNAALQQQVEQFEQQLAAWQAAARQALESGKQPPPRPSQPRNPLTGQHRPGNLYCGVLQPVIGYGIRGVIWYQGESNAGRAYQYRHMFPLMIRTWREAWGVGDFPFYWVQLADFKAQQPQPQESDWAELREAQTMTLDQLPNTGQAVIIDLGEGNDIHPRNKQDVARRLARIALARDYGRAIAWQCPRYKSMQRVENKIVITLQGVDGALRAHDAAAVQGFAIAGADRKFVWAQARIVAPDKVEVFSEQVPEPVAVRYAWADNPVCNLVSGAGLPVTPFRTDDWPGITADVHR
jgi:sialate O-acetylesterase